MANHTLVQFFRADGTPDDPFEFLFPVEFKTWSIGKEIMRDKRRYVVVDLQRDMEDEQFEFPVDIAQAKAVADN